jgi:hypothetical protein
MEQQLLNYIEQESKRGVPELMVKKALRDAGWSDAQVNEAFSALESKIVPMAPVSPAAMKDESEDGLADEGVKKPGKPVLAAALVFAGLALIIGALIIYFDFYSRASDLSENNNPTPAAPVNRTTNNATSSASKNVKEPAPKSVNQISPSTPAPVVAATSTADTATARDNQRMADMQKMAAAQTTWQGVSGHYYTCGLAGGDCKGKPYGYPVAIGSEGTVLAKTPQDPLLVKLGAKKAVCGKDYVYCGLNNASYPQFFCYFAKLEGGGYYAASYKGSAKISIQPRTFEECAGIY